MVITRRDLNSILHRARRVTPEEESDLIERYIDVGPSSHSENDAVLRDSGVPIWAIVGYMPAVGGSLDQAAEDYEVPLDAVIASMYYYWRNKTAIDRHIESNYAPTEA